MGRVVLANVFPFSVIAENWDFLLLRRNLALAETLLCSHLSGFPPDCDTWNFEVQGIQRTWLHSLLGERRNFWVTDGSFQLTFLEMGMWISRRKSWALVSMMGKKDYFLSLLILLI